MVIKACNLNTKALILNSQHNVLDIIILILLAKWEDDRASILSKTMNYTHKQKEFL